MNEGLPSYVARVAKRKKFKKLAQSFELKPNFYGVGINLNALIEDLPST